MGTKRPKGKPKKKSIRAPLTCDSNTKQKFSRFGKKQKKGLRGEAANFIGRSACLRRLQLTLKDFRRLCILKGIYPRQPQTIPGKKQGQTFYHIKDIKAISHEPVLEKFREFRAFMKKVKRAAGRYERDEALRRNENLPSYTLHHLVKERYPRFQDALADIDDALTLTFLFAALPAEHDIPAKISSKAKSLAAAWGAYAATTCSITKSFISVKGVYIEALIQGIPVRWVVPHSFTQHMPEEVDYKVMMTFFEFYETMLGFVLYKLYSDIGVRFPFATRVGNKDIVGSTSAVLGANLRVLTGVLQESKEAISNVVIESVQNEKPKEDAPATTSTTDEKQTERAKELLASVDGTLKKLEKESKGVGEEDEEGDADVAGPLKAALEQMDDENQRAMVPGSKEELDDEALRRKRLFEGLTFFISREVPRGYLEMVCLAYGARVGWEGEHSPITVDDPSITHHLVDRPKLPSSFDSLPKSREYLQPQWLLDCANNLFLLPVGRYGVGSVLPPHLSPWVNDEEEGYKPAYAEEIERLKNGESVEVDAAPASAQQDVPVARDGDGDDEMVDASKEKSEESSDDEGTEEEAGDDDKKAESEDDQDDDDDDDDVAEQKAARKQEKEEKETRELAKTMMSRKAAKLYGKMQYGLARKREGAENLHKRRQEIEKEEGKTRLKQKVERLKKERKSIEDKYDQAAGHTRKKRKSS